MTKASDYPALAVVLEYADRLDTVVKPRLAGVSTLSITPLTTAELRLLDFSVELIRTLAQQNAELHERFGDVPRAA